MIDAILAILLGIVTLFGAGGAVWAYRKGLKDHADDAQLEEYNEYIATRRRMETADPGDDLDRWLRDRAKQSGGDL